MHWTLISGLMVLGDGPRGKGLGQGDTASMSDQ